MIKHEGLVPWWRYRHKQNTLGVERWCPPDVEDGEIKISVALSHTAIIFSYCELLGVHLKLQHNPRRPGHSYSAEPSLNLWHKSTQTNSLDNTAL